MSLAPFDNVAIAAPVFLLGMPRSGTMWLSQIFDASMDFAVRLSPNYSYAFKNSIGVASSRQDWLAHLAAALVSEDSFTTFDWVRETGEFERFAKSPALARWLAIKDTRFHAAYLRCMELLPDARCIYIVRHPAGALNSWRKDGQFPQGEDFAVQWRSGACRKLEGLTGEYWGFDDWIKLTTEYLERERAMPERYLTVRYEDLVKHPLELTGRMFAFAGSQISDGVVDFLKRSHARHDDRAHSVFKTPAVADRWRSEMPRSIQDAIASALRGSPLERFI